MDNKSARKLAIDPLKNLTELINFLTEIVLKYSLIFIVILGAGFLIIIFLLLNFFNLFGF